ncbi:MAG: hypothetical protein ACLT3W_05520 [Bifidobacterium pseudocatenulatum]
MSDNWLDVITGKWEGFDFSVELFLDESSLFLSLALSDVFFLALDLASEESVVPSSARIQRIGPGRLCRCLRLRLSSPQSHAMGDEQADD